MEWIAPVIAIVAALAAVWQAGEAARANRGAKAHERSALDAQQRVAAALERQATLAEKAAKPAIPWVFEALSPANVDQKWRATNNTGYDAADVILTTPDGADEQWIEPQSHGALDVSAGDDYLFTFTRRFTSPSSRTVTIRWTQGDERLAYTHRVA